MNERIKLISVHLAGESSFPEAVFRFAIHRKTGCKWVQRDKEGGITTIREFSQAPEVHPTRPAAARAAAYSPRIPRVFPAYSPRIPRGIRGGIRGGGIRAGGRRRAIQGATHDTHDPHPHPPPDTPHRHLHPPANCGGLGCGCP